VRVRGARRQPSLAVIFHRGPQQAPTGSCTPLRTGARTRLGRRASRNLTVTYCVCRCRRTSQPFVNPAAAAASHWPHTIANKNDAIIGLAETLRSQALRASSTRSGSMAPASTCKQHPLHPSVPPDRRASFEATRPCAPRASALRPTPGRLSARLVLDNHHPRPELIANDRLRSSREQSLALRAAILRRRRARCEFPHPHH